MLAHKHFTKHQIISHNGTAGKNLCVAPLTGAMVQCLEERADGCITLSESDRVAQAMHNASVGQPAHFQPDCVLSKVEFLKLQIRLLTKQMALLQFENNTNNQEKAHEMYLLYQQMRQKAKKRLAKEQAVSRQLRKELNSAKHQLTKGCHSLAEQYEAHNQLTQQLVQEKDQREELRRQLQDKQLESEVHIQQQSSTQLQAQLQKVQADLEDSRAVAAAKADEVSTLQFQNAVLKQAKERVQDELRAAAAASHSAAQAAQAQHEKEVASHTREYTRLNDVFDKEVQEQRENIGGLETQLAQVPACHQAAVQQQHLRPQQLRPQQQQAELQKQQRSDGEAEDQLSSIATTHPGQDPSSVLSKAVMLHGMGALPSLAGLKPGQGRGQTDGAVSDSPTAPGSPLIAAKTPFSQVSRPAQERKQSPLGSPQAEAQAMVSQGDKLGKQGAGPAGHAMSAARAAAEHDSDDPGRGGRDNDGQPEISANGLGMNRSQGLGAPDGSLPLMPADVRPKNMKTNRADEPAALSEEVVKKRRQNAQEQLALPSSQHAAEPVSAHEARTTAVHDQVPDGDLFVGNAAADRVHEHAPVLKKASSEAVLDLVEARPVQNATDRSTGHEVGGSQQCGSAYVQGCEPGGDVLGQLQEEFVHVLGSKYWWHRDPSKRLVAQGGSAKVYSGLKLEADGSRVQVALKHLFSPHHVNSAEREAAILQDVSGRGYTVPFYDLFKEQPGNLRAGVPHTAQTAWLVTGLAEGKDLETICRRINAKAKALQPGPELNSLKEWTWNFSLHVFVMLAKALCDIHKTRSHRDIKLANVMVSGWDVDGGLQLKIIDWGSSRLHEEHVLNEANSYMKKMANGKVIQQNTMGTV
ncbi:hypothetical protein WJX82_007818 [Trebouxia sp. C0006]